MMEAALIQNCKVNKVNASRITTNSIVLLLLLGLAGLSAAATATATAASGTSSSSDNDVPFLQTKPSGGNKWPAKLLLSVQQQQQAQVQQPQPRMNVRRRHQDARGQVINRNNRSNRALKHKKKNRNHHSTPKQNDDISPAEVASQNHTSAMPDKETADYSEEVVAVEDGQEDYPTNNGRTSKHNKGSKKASKSKGAKKAQYYYEDEEEEETHYASKSKGKKGKKGERGGKGKRGKKQHSSSSDLRYFEASLLLEMKDHYTADLSHLDLVQLENAVQETYNTLSAENCDLQGRELIDVTMEPTPTSTGYIFHMQGQCYNCDPSHVRLFAHEDDIFYMPIEGAGTMESYHMNMTMPPGMMSNMTMVPQGNVTMMSNTPGINNATQSPTASELDTNSTVRNRFGSNGLLKKKPRTASKQKSRLQRSQDYIEDDKDSDEDWTYGLTAESRAAYGGGRGRKLSGNGHGNLHNVNRNPEARAHGENINREPEPIADLEPLDRNGHVYSNIDGNPMTADIEPQMEEGHSEMEEGHIIHPIVIRQESKKRSKKAKKKGYNKSSKSSRSGNGATDGTGGYHPVRECQTPDATHRAPTEEGFVLSLNDVTDVLLAQYNSLGINSAVQVDIKPCSATEETFDSALVVQFMGPTPAGSPLSPEEIVLVEKMMLQSYNHLQATESCDLPDFREITELVLRGIAQGPSEATFLAMFSVRGTCRGEGCSEGATFFDPLDKDQRSRELASSSGMKGVGFNTVLTRSGHPIEYNAGSAHVYHEQCYCPFKIEEFGPPFISDMEEVVGETIEKAYDVGMLTSVASVIDIVEVGAPETANDSTAAPTDAPAGTESVESFVIVQFFGAQEAVTEREVNAIEDSMPKIYADLQANSFCDSENRVLDSAKLQTVDPGPTEDSFLLGFSWEGTCSGSGCSDEPMFFATSGDAFVPCEDIKVEGAPIIDDFENDLFQMILTLREEDIIVNVQASGDAVEVLPGSTPAPFLSAAGTPSPSISIVADETLPPTAAPSISTAAPSLSARSEMVAEFKARYANRETPAPSQETPAPSEAPTSYPTWLDTDYPTYLVPWGDDE